MDALTTISAGKFFKMKNGDFVFVTSEIQESSGDFLGRNFNSSDFEEKTFNTRLVLTQNPEISEVIEKLRKLKIKARKPGFVEYFNGIKEQLLLAARAIKKPLITKRNSDKAQCANRVVIHS